MPSRGDRESGPTTPHDLRTSERRPGFSVAVLVAVSLALTSVAVVVTVAIMGSPSEPSGAHSAAEASASKEAPTPSPMRFRASTRTGVPWDRMSHCDRAMILCKVGLSIGQSPQLSAICGEVSNLLVQLVSQHNLRRYQGDDLGALFDDIASSGGLAEGTQTDSICSAFLDPIAQFGVGRRQVEGLWDTAQRGQCLDACFTHEVPSMADCPLSLATRANAWNARRCSERIEEDPARHDEALDYCRSECGLD